MTPANGSSDFRILNDQAPRLAPWEAEPYRLWSLLDMEIYQAERLLVLGFVLGESRTRTAFIQSLPRISSAVADYVGEQVVKQTEEAIRRETDGRITLNFHFTPLDPDAMAEVHVVGVRNENRELLKEAIQVVDKLRLSNRWKARLTRLLNAVDDSDATTLRVRLDELVHDLTEEMKEPVFLYISPAQRSRFEQAEPPFGEAVVNKFPSARRDIEAATRCLALDQWTASVFHSMRALECGLHALAKSIGVAFPAAVELENWKNIIDKIESEIRKLEQLPKGLGKSEKTRTYSAIASQFRYFKDAWRNHVAHAREHYDSREAELVWHHVKDFMQTLALVV